MRRSVLLFARYAELFGAEMVSVDLADGATVADLIAALRALPGGALLPPQPFVAVAHAQAAPGDTLPADAELALLPPLAGG
jgi:molybdopterin synthase catalytic subunit